MKSTAFIVSVSVLTGAVFGGLCIFIGWLIGQGGSGGDSTDIVNSPVGDYYVGVGRHDVTGPISQVNLMGYALPSQIAHGLHMRLYARSFIVSDLERKNKVVFVSVDNGMGSQIVKLEVVKKLKELYSDEYDERNIAISGQHTHSSPAGFLQFFLYQITSAGFIKDATDAVVNGVVRSIVNAHNNLQPGFISFATNTVDDGNINRSLYGYEQNPQELRDKYSADTEQVITGLRFMDVSKNDIGLFSWYPVHGTSMNRTNQLINPDNKGRASTLYEKLMAKTGEIAGKESYVAAFAQANLGDVSPNTAGPRCVDTGEACDYKSSTCPNENGEPRVHNCYALGPGNDMFESTDIIARKQFEAAKGLSNWVDVQGPVGFGHQYVDMQNQEITLDDGSTVQTCRAGLGYSFAAGCTDGTGAFDFIQGMTTGTLLWNNVRDILIAFTCTEAPTQAYYNCHKPKPVLFPSGYMDIPYTWHPSIVDVQVFRIGQFFIAAVPGEFTTMAGRILKEDLKAKAEELGSPSNTHVVLAGLSNVYSHYITTFEEYQAQRYEDASTLFGPHTHAVYLKKYDEVITSVMGETQISSGPLPENLLDVQIELLPAPFVDTVPIGVNFGDVLNDTQSSYNRGNKVSVTFFGANPRHDMKLGGTHFEIQKQSGSEWVTMATDTDWETKFIWQRLAEINRTAQQVNFIEGIVNTLAAHFGLRIQLEKIKEITEQKSGFDFRGRSVEELLELGVVTKESPKDLTSQTTESYVTIEWDIPVDQATGTYRIIYYGVAKRKTLTKKYFTGISSSFQVTT